MHPIQNKEATNSCLTFFFENKNAKIVASVALAVLAAFCLSMGIAGIASGSFAVILLSSISSYTKLLAITFIGVAGSLCTCAWLIYKHQPRNHALSLDQQPAVVPSLDVISKVESEQIETDSDDEVERVFCLNP